MHTVLSESDIGLAHIGLSEFEKINRLPINNRFERCVSSKTFKYFNNLSPSCFKPAAQHTANTRTSLLKPAFAKCQSPSKQSFLSSID